MTYFYPRSPCGERRRQIKSSKTTLTFLSTLSLRRATNIYNICRFQPGFLSTLSLRRATPEGAGKRQPAQISIHALLAESDKRQMRGEFRDVISIHALLAESDIRTICFMPTGSISIHALLAESDGAPVDRMPSSSISIHALLAESDGPAKLPKQIRKDFYPRSPCGERLEFRKLLYPASTNFYPRSPCGERR